MDKTKVKLVVGHNFDISTSLKVNNKDIKTLYGIETISVGDLYHNPHVEHFKNDFEPLIFGDINTGINLVEEQVFDFGVIEPDHEMVKMLFGKYYEPNIEATVKLNDYKPDQSYKLVKHREKMIRKVIRDKRFSRPVTYYTLVHDLKFKIK